MPQTKKSAPNKIIIFLIISASILISPVALAQTGLEINPGVSYVGNAYLDTLARNGTFNIFINILVLLLAGFSIMSIVTIIKGAFAHYTSSGNDDKIVAAEGLMYKGAILLAVIFAVSFLGHYLISKNRIVSADDEPDLGISVEELYSD